METVTSLIVLFCSGHVSAPQSPRRASLSEWLAYAAFDPVDLCADDVLLAPNRIFVVLSYGLVYATRLFMADMGLRPPRVLRENANTILLAFAALAPLTALFSAPRLALGAFALALLAGLEFRAGDDEAFASARFRPVDPDSVRADPAIYLAWSALRTRQLDFAPWAPAAQELAQRAGLALASAQRAAYADLCQRYQGLWFGPEHAPLRHSLRAAAAYPRVTCQNAYAAVRSNTHPYFFRVGLAIQFVESLGFPPLTLGDLYPGTPVRYGCKLGWALAAFVGKEAEAAHAAATVAWALAPLGGAWSRRHLFGPALVALCRPALPGSTREANPVFALPTYPRLVNVFSDMEVFASQGGSLLAFVFLALSFFARILLVVALAGVL